MEQIERLHGPAADSPCRPPAVIQTKPTGASLTICWPALPGTDTGPAAGRLSGRRRAISCHRGTKVFNRRGVYCAALSRGAARTGRPSDGKTTGAPSEARFPTPRAGSCPRTPGLKAVPEEQSIVWAEAGRAAAANRNARNFGGRNPVRALSPTMVVSPPCRSSRANAGRRRAFRTTQLRRRWPPGRIRAGARPGPP